MKQINKKAFTLVELLVVVLIIGILAAIAVPQYQVAVIKSRVATILPIMRNLVDAEEVYYLANDKYTQLFRNLDVSITPVCTKAEYEQHQTCGNDFLLVLSDGLLHAVYCPGANTSIKECNKKAEFAIYGFFQNSSNMQYKGSWRCAKQNNSDFGVKICKALPFLGNNY